MKLAKGFEDNTAKRVTDPNPITRTGHGRLPYPTGHVIVGGRQTRVVTVLLLLVTGMFSCSRETVPPYHEYLLAALKGEHAVAVVDTTDLELKWKLPTGIGPHQVAAHPSGRAVTANYGSPESPGFSLTVLDLHRFRVRKTVPLGEFERPHGIGFLQDGRRVVVGSEKDRAVLVCDIETGRLLQEIPTLQKGTAYICISEAKARVYAASPESGSLAVLDLDESRLLTLLPVGKSLWDPALSPSGAELWIPDRSENALFVVDTHRLQIRDRVPCPGEPVAASFVPGTSFLVVVCAGSADLAVFDTPGRREAARYSLDWMEIEPISARGGSLKPIPFSVAVDRSGRRAYVSHPIASLVTVLDLYLNDNVPATARSKGTRFPEGYGVPLPLTGPEMPDPRAEKWVLLVNRLRLGQNPEGLALVRLPSVR